MVIVRVVHGFHTDRGTQVIRWLELDPKKWILDRWWEPGIMASASHGYAWEHLGLLYMLVALCMTWLVTKIKFVLPWPKEVWETKQTS